MKNLIFIIFFFSSCLIAKELTLQCENGSSYKINYIDKSNIRSYYKDKNNWIEVEKIEFNNDSIELFIPNQQYLSCADESLPICEYSILISNILDTRPSISEVVINNCFIGTMGCNEYEKGLKLNKSFCIVK